MLQTMLFIVVIVLLSSHGIATAAAIMSWQRVFSRTTAKVLSTISLTVSLANPCLAAVDNSFQDQLRVIQVLQQEGQRDRVLDAEKKVRNTVDSDDVILARGIVSLATTGLANRVDPSQYPFGFERADALDSKFAGNKAALIITAVGRNGPPVAAKKLPLAGLQFPLVFEISDRDLIFPYNRDIWINSPLSKDSVAITCILDSDGVLATADSTDRFGFAISDPVQPASTRMPKNKEAEAISTKPLLVPLRGEAKISINLKSDGKAYTQAETELLSRVDSELDRLAR